MGKGVRNFYFSYFRTIAGKDVIRDIDYEIYFYEFFNSIFPVCKQLLIFFVQILSFFADKQAGDVIVIFRLIKGFEVGEIFFNDYGLLLHEISFYSKTFFLFI